MIPDFKTFLRESIWTDMEDRGTGSLVKNEDDIELLDGEALVDYLNKHYKNTSVYKIFIDINKVVTIPLLYKGGHYAFMRYYSDERKVTVSDIFPSISCYVFDKLCDKYQVTKGQDNTKMASCYCIEPKELAKPSNEFMLEVLDFIIKNVSKNTARLVKRKDSLKESIWSEMEDRGSGDSRKKEDDVNLMDGEQFCNYLKSRYDVDNSRNIYKPVDIRFNSSTQGGFIDIPLFLQDSRRKTQWYQDHASFLYYPNHAVGFGCGAAFLDKYISQKLCDKFITPENGIIYKDRYFKSGHITNELVVEMIDFVIDTINEDPRPKKTLKPAYPFLIRKNGLRESIWTDMEDRGTGEIVKKEDEVNHLDGPGFLEYLKDYYNIPDESWTFQYTEYSDTVSIRTFSSPWVPKKGTYMSFVNTTGFKNGERVMKVDNDIFKHKGLNNLRKALRERYTFKKTDMGTMVFPIDGSPITNQAVIDLIDCIMNNLDPGFEVHLPKIVKESVWDDMQDRGTGDAIKTEDDVNHLDFQDLAKYIEDNYTLDDEDVISVITSQKRVRGVSVLIMRLKDAFRNDFYLEYSYEYGDTSDDLDVVVPANVIDTLRPLFNKVRSRYSLERIDRNTLFGPSSFVRIIPNRGEVDNKFFLEVLDFIISNTTSYIHKK